ncbi:MAG TPA: GNAT family N-acetyltransferase [Reyranella sp.]|nr:GNAT family N-acetyltransferase [Reyranella sp.]
MELIVPSLETLPQFVDALKRGWSPDNIRLEEAAREFLGMIAKDAAAFIARCTDREAKGGDVTLPDGSTVPRLPGFVRWMWDGEFCGQIGFRWQPGTEALPKHCLGHIGYAVVPWKRGNGYATKALGLMLAEARQEGLRWVELTTDPDNVASQKVITGNGGVFIERFFAEAAYGADRPELRWRISLTGPGPESQGRETGSM